MLVSHKRGLDGRICCIKLQVVVGICARELIHVEHRRIRGVYNPNISSAGIAIWDVLVILREPQTVIIFFVIGG